MTVAELKQQVILTQEVSLEDFFVLLSTITGQSKAFLFSHDEYLLTEEETASLGAFLKRRALHEPVSYLTQEKEFFGRTFFVNQDVLIPRPETELLIENVLQQVATSAIPLTFIDIGTGSGAIILTLAEELKVHDRAFTYLGLDISSEALVVAETNKTKLRNTNVQFLQSDLLASLPEIHWDSHLIFLANLPYVPEEQYQNAMPDVVLYEPAIALVSGIDGLNHYRRLIQELSHKKLSSFTLYLEIDPSQTITLRTLLEQSFPGGRFELFKDLASHDRLIRYTL